MIYDRHPELDRVNGIKHSGLEDIMFQLFSNITEEAIKKIYKRAGRRVKKERFKKYRFIVNQNNACHTCPFGPACPPPPPGDLNHHLKWW